MAQIGGQEDSRKEKSALKKKSKELPKFSPLGISLIITVGEFPPPEALQLVSKGRCDLNAED